MVTTESAQATEEQARALGADFFLRKPVGAPRRRARARRGVPWLARVSRRRRRRAGAFARRASAIVEALLALWHEADELHARLSPGFFRRPDAGRGRQRAAEALRDAARREHETMLVADRREGAVCGLLRTCASTTRRAAAHGVGSGAATSKIWWSRGATDGAAAAARSWRRPRRGRAATARSSSSRRCGTGNARPSGSTHALGYRRISQVLGTDL